jgi:hypothetical protein
MKHSKKDRNPRSSSKGYSSKGKEPNPNIPISIADILEEDLVKFEKDDISIEQISIRTEPTNDSSPVIKLNFKPLNNPKKVIAVLRGLLLIIKKGVTGNNIMTGPLQYAYWRGCLTGEALRQFSLFSTNVGTETTANLLTVEQRLGKFFAPRDVLSKQHRYMCYTMRKPYGRSTRQYVGAVNEMNQMLTKLPPGYDDTQKISDTDMIDNLTVLAPREHKNLMIEHRDSIQERPRSKLTLRSVSARKLKKMCTRKLKGISTRDLNPMMNQTLLTRKRERKRRKSTRKGRNTSASIMVPIRLMAVTLVKYYSRKVKTSQLGRTTRRTTRTSSPSTRTKVAT